MKTTVFLFFILIISITSCKEAEEENPICKKCYDITYAKGTDSVISVSDTLTACAGDLVAWENLPDDVTDSTITKYECK